MKNGKHTNLISGIILQASVSDRESYEYSYPDLKKQLDLATQMIQQGKQDELMPRSTEYAPITAYRFHSLAGEIEIDALINTSEKWGR